ncbi:MAG TPA: SpoIIE family protein phosphatase, partial [Opitutales bacterium]|nr:SpoIIE family protein phosphatase [Opitutales bacterium]
MTSVISVAFALCFAVASASVWICVTRRRHWKLRLDEERQARAREREIVLSFMHSFVEAVGQGVTREELMRRVVHSAVTCSGALSGCVFEVKGRELAAVAVEGLFPPQLPLPRGTNLQMSTRSRFIEGILRSERIPFGAGIIGSVAASGEAVFLPDASQDPRVVKMDDPSLVTRCIIAIPIRFQNRLTGVMAVANAADGFPFTQNDYSMMWGIAEQAGLALHNLDLIETQKAKNKMDVDLVLASSIQAMLLPKKMPESPFIDVAALYLPAQKVGGDLYDVFRIDENRIGVALADVSGKGVPASIIMAICQSNLRHLARSGINPARVLADLNAIMRDEMRRDMFVTMIYGIVDTAEDTLTIARAGHELPILLRKGLGGEFETVFVESD